MANYQRRALQRRIRTNRPVLEMMTEFWENHLNVPVNGDEQFTYRAPYGDHIREHALGKFYELLVGAITHPAMLIYLDQATSTKRHPNENLGRTDHGYGNVMFLAGAGVRGGAYYAKRPGLANSLDADLLVTTDYRSVSRR